MPNIIDSLIVELGFDTSGLNKGGKEIDATLKRVSDNATRSGKQIEDVAKHVDETIGKVRNTLVDLFLVFTGGREIKEFVEDITRSDVALGRLSRSTEQAVGTIAELEGAAAAGGGTVEGMAATISNLQSAAQEMALTGRSAALPYLRALGIELKRNKDGAVDVGDELIQMAAAGQHLGAARATALFKGAGVTDEGTLNLLLQGPAAIARYRAEINAAGTPKPADIAAANDRNRAWAVFNAALTTVGRNILTALTPALLRLGDALTKIAEAVSKSPGLMAAASVAAAAFAGAIGLITLRLAYLASGLKFIAPAVLGVVRVLGTALATGIARLLLSLSVLTAEAFPAFSAAIFSLGAAIEATPIGWLITGVAALGIAGYELIEHWSAVKGFFRDMWDGIASYFAAGADKISKLPIVRWVLRQFGVGSTAVPAPRQTAKAAPSSAPTSAADRAINTVLQNEDRGLTGKVTNDSGGVTKFGISSHSFPGLDVANLSLADAKTIFKNDYWDPIGGDGLPAALQVTALDAAVNQGVKNAKDWLKLSGGDPKKFNALRRGQYEHLAEANPGKFGKYLKGWLSRIPSDTSASVATASRGVPSATPLGRNAQTASQAGTNIVTNNNSSETSIGHITVNTRATDARGIASALRGQLQRGLVTASSQNGAG